MKRSFHFLIFILITLFCFQVSKAQDFRTQKANRFFQQTYYSKAIPLYEELIRGSTDSQLILNLADSYYYTFDVKNAARYYGLLEARYPKKFDQQHQFQYIQTLKALNNYEEAEEISKKYLYASAAEQENFQQELNYLENVKAIGNRFEIKNLPLNTAQSEFSIAAYKDKIVFASTEKSTGLFSKTYYWNNSPYLNLYEVEEKSVDTATQVKLFSEELTTRFHESNAVFTSDGNTVYFTRNNYIDGKKKRDDNRVTQLQIYRAGFKDGKWSDVTSLPINSDTYSTEHPALSPDGKTLYFASNKPGGYGGFDLYKVNTNNFQNPENLGSTINTKHKEQFPFIDKEENLYFASDGHPGFGFLDIFISKPTEDGFEKPDNIGLPVNSGYDDFAFYKNNTSRNGYFSSNRPKGKGSDDIYKFHEELPLVIEDCYQYISGTVTDKTTQELLANAKVVLFENSTAKDSIITNDEAYFKFKVNCSTAYQVIGSKKGYQNDTVQVSTNSIRKKEHDASLVLTSEKEIKRIEKENLVRREREKQARITAEKIKEEKLKLAEAKAKEIKQQERITNITTQEKDIVKDEEKNRFFIKTDPIYFDYDLWYIRKESRVILNKVIDLLNKYPDMHIEIGTHTDVRGNNKYNKDLSQKRSNSVLEYFESKGITKERVIAKGYGETQPIIKCIPEDSCTEEQHEINRRCEFVILSF